MQNTHTNKDRQIYRHTHKQIMRYTDTHIDTHIQIQIYTQMKFGVSTIHLGQYKEALSQHSPLIYRVKKKAITYSYSFGK